MKRIRILREEKHMSQQRLALELNVSQEMISRYELDKSIPNIDMIIKIAKYFRVSTDYLLEFSDDKVPIDSYGLTKKEKEILLCYKRMDSRQKEKLEAYLKSIEDNPKLFAKQIELFEELNTCNKRQRETALKILEVYIKSTKQ